jgi:hypothetical protein
MDNENVIEELYALRKDLKFLGYAIWALGTMLNLRAQTGSHSEEPVQLKLDSPEGRELGREALKGFLTLAKFAMDEYGKPDSTLPIPSSWRM